VFIKRFFKASINRACQCELLEEVARKNHQNRLLKCTVKIHD